MQSWLQYRRFGAELRALQEQDSEQFHRHHSRQPHDRISLHKALNSGDSRHAALGDQFYLPAPSSVAQPVQLKQEHSSSDPNTKQFDTWGGFGPNVDGVEPQDKRTEKDVNNQVYVVHFAHNDPDNPQNWSTTVRILCILQVALIGFLTLLSSSIDAAIAPQAAEALHVSDVVESLATGVSIYLNFNLAS